MKIRKGNKVKYVEEGRLEVFLKQGYEQIDEETGEVIRRATGGSVVPIAQYNLLLDEVEKLKNSDNQQEIEDLKSEVEQLKKENASLKGKITKLEKADPK